MSQKVHVPATEQEIKIVSIDEPGLPTFCELMFSASFTYSVTFSNETNRQEYYVLGHLMPMLGHPFSTM